MIRMQMAAAESMMMMTIMKAMCVCHDDGGNDGDDGAQKHGLGKSTTATKFTLKFIMHA